jgi:hypothetical protein
MTEKCCTHGGKRMQPPPLAGVEKELVDALLEHMARPAAVIERVVAGDKFVAVVADGRVGLSSLLGARPSAADDEQTRTAVGRTVGDVARNLAAPSAYAIGLGMAALNAANAPDPSRVAEADLPADALIARLGREGSVGLVGEFPFVASLRARVPELYLFEQNGTPDAVPPSSWDETLSRLTVLAVTATALLTRQMAYFLSRARQSTIIVLGPTTPLSSALFDYGADYLSGSVVTDPERVLEGIRAGLPFKQVKRNGGVRFTCWTRSDLPTTQCK